MSDLDDHKRSKHQRQNTRYYTICPALEAQYGDVVNLFCSCSCCGRFRAICCHAGPACQKTRVVFVDGACLDNGFPGARSGMGIAFGDREHQQSSLPIHPCHDPDGPRTNQRAELLAAHRGLMSLHNAHIESFLKESITENDERASISAEGQIWIIAMDSEYVVKGIVEWMPKWEARNWRTTAGNTPMHLDLFQKLMFFVDECEEAFDVQIKFRWLPREENKLADSLAKQGANRARPGLW